MVDNGIYNAVITGEHRGASFQNVSVNAPTTLNTYVIDNDDMNESSPFSFRYDTFRNLFMTTQNGSPHPLWGWNKNPKLRMYTGSWDKGIIPSDATTIMNTVASAFVEGIDKMGNGRLIKLRVDNANNIEYIQGDRDPNALPPNDGYVEYYAVVNDTDDLGHTWCNVSGYEITGCKTQINVKRIGDLYSLSLITKHEGGRALGMFGVDESVRSVMNNNGVFSDIQQIDMNNGTMAYSLPLGFSSSTGAISKPLGQPSFFLQKPGK